METPGEHLVSLFIRMTAADFENAVAQGEFDLTETSLDDALDSYFARRSEGLDEANLPIEVSLDYSESILTEARRFRTDRRFQFAVLFYGTWIEHWANRVLVDGARRHHLGDRSAMLFVRKLSIIEKLEVAWEIFGWGEFPSAELRAATRIMDVRNSFAHYKYLAFAIDGDPHEAAVDACTRAEELIPKLQALEAKALYGMDSIEDMTALRAAILEKLEDRRPDGLPPGWT